MVDYWGFLRKYKVFPKIKGDGMKQCLFLTEKPGENGLLQCYLMYSGKFFLEVFCCIFMLFMQI